MDELRLFELVERGVGALETLNENFTKVTTEADVEIEPTPPQCPHCRQVNPTVLIDADGGRGPLLEYILAAICVHCHKKFYVLFTGWAIFANRDQARQNGQILVEGMMGKRD